MAELQSLEELGGAVDDLLLHEELIRRIANVEEYAPKKPGRPLIP